MSTNISTTIVFSKEFVKQLELTHRIPSTSIGVKRIRPRHMAVLKELGRQKRAKKEQTQTQTQQNTKSLSSDDVMVPTSSHSNVGEKDGEESTSTRTRSQGNIIVSWFCDHEDDTIERIAIAAENHQRSISEADDTCNNHDDDNEHGNNDNNGKQTNNIEVMQRRQCHHKLDMDIDSSAIQEEIEELRHEDRRVFNNLPILLSPPMVHQARKLGLIGSHSSSNKNTETKKRYNDDDIHASRIIQHNVIDDEFALRWARLLHRDIEMEEKKRNEEDLRPLVYNLKPEVWRRLRPSSSGTDNSIIGREENIKAAEEEENRQKNEDNGCGGDNTVATNEDDTLVLCRNIRAHSSKAYDNSWYNKTHDIVYDCLYNTFPNFHISCGAKFGCDYLVYDGCRMDRHAFAGLRIISSDVNTLNYVANIHDYDDGCFPRPTPFDLTGFVRTLNTAGKLALLAMVVEVECGHTSNAGKDVKSDAKQYNVAIVDLVLEKVVLDSRLQKKRR